MTSLLAFCVGLLVAGIVRIYLGERHADKLAMFNTTLASIALLAWIVDGHHRMSILLVAFGLLFGTFVFILPGALRKLTRLQTVAFSAWMLMLGGFVIKALIVE